MKIGRQAVKNPSCSCSTTGGEHINTITRIITITVTSSSSRTCRGV